MSFPFVMPEGKLSLLWFFFQIQDYEILLKTQITEFKETITAGKWREGFQDSFQRKKVQISAHKFFPNP